MTLRDSHYFPNALLCSLHTTPAADRFVWRQRSSLGLLPATRSALKPPRLEHLAFVIPGSPHSSCPAQPQLSPTPTAGCLGAPLPPVLTAAAKLPQCLTARREATRSHSPCLALLCSYGCCDGGSCSHRGSYKPLAGDTPPTRDKRHPALPAPPTRGFPPLKG